MSNPNMKYTDASSVIWKYAWQGRRTAQLLFDMAFGGNGLGSEEEGYFESIENMKETGITASFLNLSSVGQSIFF